MPYFDDFDSILYEPSPRRRKYRFHRNERLTKRWSVLLSISALDDIYESESSQANHHHHHSSSPLGGGHKPSFKGTKLARRARSFKDDFLGKISQMRSPGGTMVGSLPRNQGSKNHSSPKISNMMGSHEKSPYSVPSKGPLHELDDNWKQTQMALKYLRDVVSKQTLEMLSGTGTIVLDTVWHINLTVKSSIKIEKGSTIETSIKRVYQTVARLIKLCDDALIDSQSSELKKENVNDIVVQVEEAVKTLIELARDHISEDQSQMYKTTPRSSFGTLEAQSQRNSLPDIPLTDREMQIIKQQNHQPPVRGSHSTESILRDPSPPPKPPLPISLRNKFELSGCVTPPPLPPKKKNQMRLFSHLMDDSFSANSSTICGSAERMSMRSRSPDDSISLRSEGTGSIDSMLNHSSKEEEEIRALMDCERDGDILDNHPSDIFGIGSNNSWEESSLSSGISNNNLDHHTSVNDYHRLSNTDSGIVSISYSKRSSQQSSVSAQFCKFQGANEPLYSESQNVKNFTHESSSSTTSSSMMVVSNSSHSIVSRDNVELREEDTPPALPQKTKRKTDTNRQPSPYDNVPEENSMCEALQGELLVTCHQHQSHHSQTLKMSNSSVSSSINFDEIDGKPPPLPPKKKHIMAYMEMFGNCSHTNDEFMRHSVHIAQSQWGQTNMGGMSTAQSCSFSHTLSHSTRNSSPSDLLSSRLTLPAPAHNQRVPSPLHSPNTYSVSSSSSNSSVVPPALPPKQKTRKKSCQSPPGSPTGILLKEPKLSSHPPSPNPMSLPDLLEHTVAADAPKIHSEDEHKCSKHVEADLMEELEVDNYLVYNKSDEDAPDLKGGTVDALIIQATKATKNGEERESVFAYQEAFLTTYRTFIQPYELISKLIRRYNYFYNQPEKRTKSREAFALMVRVVSDLTALDLDDALQRKLMNFVQQLISCGELILAKALRVKHLERHAAKDLAIRYPTIPIHTISLSATKATLLDFKTDQIAEQLTMLDAELFMKIEIPEVLMWAQEQKEEKSPNLTRFTEHFNKMSYWARTKILTAEANQREKYFMKFIKIMKHLRKINNYNSYLALLSALDSGPIRRLEWPKQYQESVKELCTLIDSSSSFKAYRMALGETQPPCIPYIGLILQDLTFVHEGNYHMLPDVSGMINFSKRWQQFNIVENMKKFKKETYGFKKNEKIIQFFQNFDDFIGEDAMWELSQNIKPRGGKKTVS